ncbi:hypothetical protein QE152_g13465 [Popillia japonica]|uniref:Uncharacterized protein n=1 Tax=Popillia japonica TaxID=7064 RepID=A0AAW1LBJ9_POPJA
MPAFNEPIQPSPGCSFQNDAAYNVLTPSAVSSTEEYQPSVTNNSDDSNCSENAVSNEFSNIKDTVNPLTNAEGKGL